MGLEEEVDKDNDQFKRSLSQINPEYEKKLREHAGQIKSDRAEGRQEKARRLVYEYIKARLEKTDTHVTFSIDEVYVVWFCKTLQHWKCLISTSLPDQMYYEVTHNGGDDTKPGVTYIDAYKKWENVTICDWE